MLRLKTLPYFFHFVESNISNPKVLFHIVSRDTVDATSETCNEFLDSFTQKIFLIHESITSPVDPPSVCLPVRPKTRFDLFNLISQPTLLEIVNKMNPSSCPLDIVPL